MKQALASGDLAWGPLASFLLFRLLDTHPLLVDPGNASRTLLWNIHTMDWDVCLLDMFALPHSALPQCVPNKYDFGHLDVSGQNIPVRMVMGDLPASLFAAGQPDGDTAYINAGTGAFVQRVLRKSVEEVNGFLTGVTYQDEHNVLYSLEGTVNGAGSALEWFKQGMGSQGMGSGLESRADQRKKHAVRDSRPDPIPCLQDVGDVPLFLNGVSGLGSPFWEPVFESRFIGDGDLWQQQTAVEESIVFLLQINLQGMAAYVPTPTAIHIGGGLGPSGWFLPASSESGEYSGDPAFPIRGDSKWLRFPAGRMS